MSLTLVYLILAAVFVAVGIIGIILCMDRSPKQHPARYSLPWASIPIVLLFLGLAIAQSETNAEDSRNAWRESCVANGGEVVSIKTVETCLEPGYKFVSTVNN